MEANKNTNQINVGTYLMFVSYLQMFTMYRNSRKEKLSYLNTTTAPRIYCKDGFSLSVQCCYGSHCAFDDTQCENVPYPKKIGKKVVSAETDCEQLGEYGMNDINEIQSLIDKHDGIDFEQTTKNFIEKIGVVPQEENLD